MICTECKTEAIEVPAPGPLDDSFGPLGKYLFVTTTTRWVCPVHGEIGTSYFRMSDLCDIVTTKHLSKN